MTTTSPLASSSIIINRPNPNTKPSYLSLTTITTTRKTRTICCQVAVKSNDSTTVASSSQEEAATSTTTTTKIGSKVRVKVALKVYHVPRVPEIDLTGMEGVVKQYVGLWKGKRISANLPYKIEFFTEIEGRGNVKFFAHLKDDEFDYLD